MSRKIGDPLKKVLNFKLGVLPLPVFVAAALVVAIAAYWQRLSADLIGGLAVMMVAGVFLDYAGRNLPLLRNVGGPAILCLFVPSALAGYGFLGPDVLAAVKAAMKTDNLLYLYIASLVTGSILGIDRRVLSAGFLYLGIPFLVGTFSAVAAGLAAGVLLGYEAGHTFFYILVPILSGGIGEGIIPLSIAYSGITGAPQNEIVATMVPAAMIGNVIAILLSGGLAWLGDRHPSLSGDGHMVKLKDAPMRPAAGDDEGLDLHLMGAGLLLICTMFTLGGLLAPLTGIPGAVMMILCVAILKLARVLPPDIERGAYQMYRFVAVALTPAILVGLGVVFVSWSQLLDALSPSYVVICAATVLALVSTGFGVAFLMRMYPVETAIVTACHSGLGGTGDVAILSAANRMNLMPFSQVVTRLGGAGMVVLAAILLRSFG